MKTIKAIILTVVAAAVTLSLCPDASADSSMRQILLKHTPCKLHRAIIRGNRSQTKALIESQGVDINRTCLPTTGEDSPVSPLQIAIMADRPAFIKYLARKGADIQGVQRGGGTLLHLACLFGEDGKSVQVLISLGLDPNTVDGKGMTPLHNATMFQKVGSVRVLLRNGAKVNAVVQLGDMAGWTPLRMSKVAYQNGWTDQSINMAIIKMLQRAGGR